MSDDTQNERRRRWLWALFFLVALDSGAQPIRMVEEPQFLKLRFSDVNLLLEAEDRTETRRPKGSDSTFRQTTRYVAPSLSLAMEGSIYHPNLLEYHLLTKDGFYWEDVRIESDTDTNRHGNSILQNYDATVTLLRQEPYAATLFADKHRFQRDYDFFTRVRVDDERYGVRTGYSAGPVPFIVTATRADENVDEVDRPSTLDENTVLLTARNQRGNGDATDFTYTYDQYERQEQSLPTQRGTDHSARLTDAEIFGRDDLSSFNSALYFDHLDTETELTRTFSIQERMALQHTESLQSFYDYGYDERHSGDSENDGQHGRVALRHQLYESLTSEVDLHGETTRTADEDDSTDDTIFGAGLGEDYTKQLSTWGRLTLGYHGRLDHQKRTSTGTTLSIIDEPHILSDGLITLLNHPLVNRSSIHVTDATGLNEYQEILDYAVIPRGSQTEIQRVFGGRIPNGASVLVDYSATAQPSDEFDTLADYFLARLDLFDGLIGVYGRVNLIHNYGGESLVLEDVADEVAGVDLTWRGLRTGAEYENHDSNLTPYHASRLFQDYVYQLGEASSLSFDATQTWTTYPDVDRNDGVYQFIGRYQIQLMHSLGFNAEGGIRLERGQDIDRDLTTVRSGLDFAYGQLTMRLTYDLEDETYLGDKRKRNLVYLNASRSF
jgi:hypothetical protein